MSREASQGTDDAKTAAGVRGAVVVAHGGTEISREPVSPLDPAVLRMIPLALAIRHGLRGSGIVVSRPRYRVRGWNGELASPVQDLGDALDEIGARFGPIPIVLIGHSMGARAAFLVAGHPAVSAVAGLAPWLPPTEPVDQLAGRRVLLVHGSADHITSPAGNLGLRRARPCRHPDGHDRGARRRAHHAAPGPALASPGGRVQPPVAGAADEAGRRGGGLPAAGRGTAPGVTAALAECLSARRPQPPGGRRSRSDPRSR